MSDGSGGSRRQLGKILLKQKLVTAEELDDLLVEQLSHPGQRLASVARQSGKIPDVDLLKALSEQHGLPGIDLAQTVIPLAGLELIPVEIAKQHLILPLVVKEDRVFLAMADPGDRRVIDEIEFVTGRKVFPYVAMHDSLRQVIDEAYRQRERGEDHYVGPNVSAESLQTMGFCGPELRGELPAQAAPPEPRPGASKNVVTDRPVAESKFDDDLGLDDPSGRVPTGPVATVNPGTTPKILIVDDEEDVRKLLRRVLVERGYEVIEAGKGLDALRAVRDHMPSLILLDAMLPEVHGFDICRRIKGSRRYGHIPIIMVSAIYRGWRFAQDLRESYGVAVFLEKPFKISEVLNQVEAVLAGRKSEPAVEEEEISREASDSLSQGIDAFKRGALAEAIGFLKHGIGIDPLSFKLHYHLGLLHGRQEAVFEAINELETAVDLQPRHFLALKNLAVLYQRAGFKHKAIEVWKRALNHSPDDETRRGIKDHLMTLL